MKRLGVFAFAAALCLWGCNKEKSVIEGSRFPLKEAVIDISSEFTNKAVKKGWEEGDRINIWFDARYSQDSPDLVLCYDGASWVKENVREDAVVGTAGTLCALYETTNDLGAMYKEKTSTRSIYRGGNAAEDTRIKCTPMLMAANGCSYTYDRGTAKLSSQIKGWKYLTRFKVVVTGLSGNAGTHVMKVFIPGKGSAVAQPYSEFGPRKDEETSAAVIAGTTSTTTCYAGGVQEGNDTVAFYFKGISIDLDDKVYFGLRTNEVSDKLYLVSAKNAIVESSYKCQSVNLSFASFSGIIDGGIGAECPEEGGEYDFKKTYFTNPVIPSHVPDPSFWREGKKFCLTCTWLDHLYTSYDLVEWTREAAPITTVTRKQIWDEYGVYDAGRGSNYTQLWAPDIIEIGGKRLMYLTYYNNSGNCGIIVLEQVSGGKFELVGRVLSATDVGTTEAIDPEVVIDPDNGDIWLFFGSVNMYRIKLNSTGTGLASGATKTLVATSQEGAYLYRHGGYWYLFCSYVGPEGGYGGWKYKVSVGRSASLTGTFYDKENRALTTDNATPVISNDKGARFWGPGHNAEIITDRTGQDYMIYHSHDTDLYPGLEFDAQRFGMLQRIYWDKDGWPYAETGKPLAKDKCPIL